VIRRRLSDGATRVYECICRADDVAKKVGKRAIGVFTVIQVMRASGASLVACVTAL
jgi:hypothetical protein